MVLLLLSAILYSIAFFLPHPLGFLSFLSLGMLLYYFLSFPISFRAGYIWGALVFIPHFIWTYHVLVTRSIAGPVVSFMLYAGIALYFALTSGVWFWVCNKIQGLFSSLLLRVGVMLVSMAAYYTFIARFSLSFIGEIQGYPFLSPLIPLAQYRWFLLLGTFLSSFVTSSVLHVHLAEQGAPIFNESSIATTIHLPGQERIICLKLDENEEYLHEPGVVGQRIYQKLAALNLSEGDKACIIATESAFPFALNEYPEIVRFWGQALPASTSLCVGGFRTQQFNDKEKSYQSVFLIRQGRIINYYDKEKRVALAEWVPKFWRQFSWMHDLFLKDKDYISRGHNKSKQSLFTISDNLVLAPQICSDMFFDDEEGSVDSQPALGCWLVNDSWFPPYMRRILANFAVLKAQSLGQPVLYITSSGVVCLGP